jgi:hypothetical protein
MKIYVKTLLFILGLGTLFTYSGCGPDPKPEPSIEEVQLGKLKTTWKVSDVKLDGISKTTDYPGFTLSISGTVGATSFDYSTAGRPPLSPWPSSGTWKFGTDPATQLVRDPGAGATNELPMTYTVTDTQLQITFTFARDGYTARTSNVKGVWVFTFTK